MKSKRILIGTLVLSLSLLLVILVNAQKAKVEDTSYITFQSNKPRENCPITQLPESPFTPPPPYPPGTPSPGEFWYGSAALWTMLQREGTWRELPYSKDEGGHYFNKVFWWNEDYDWQTEPRPKFTVTGHRLDDPEVNLKTSEATNAYDPTFGSAILTGVEIPTPGCWEITGHYGTAKLSFIVWIAPHDK